MSYPSIAAAFLRRDWRTDLSYRAPFVLQTVAVLLSLALFFYLSRIVDNDEFSASQGLSGGYFAFVTIGLAMFQIVRASLVASSAKLREEQTTGTLEALLATPASPSVIILASSTYDLLRATVTGFAVVAFAILIFGLDLAPDPGGLAIALLGLIGAIGLFSALGVAVAAFTIVFKRGMALTGLALSVISLLGGIYFPVTVLPAPLEAVANVLPFTWALDVVRAGILNGDVDELQLLGVGLAVLVLTPVSLALFGASVRRARQTGTLAQY